MYTLINMATLQKKTSRGQTYWQIVESRRVNGKPRPIVLLHLGTADKLMQRLTQGPGLPVKAKVVQFGALAALWKIAEELQVVEIIDRHARKRAQGLSCGQYMLLAALNRCTGATSKASLYDWYHQTVLQRLLPAPKKLLSSQRFWDHMNYLDTATLDAIEKDLTQRLLEHFKIDAQTLLFDATNFDTYINTQTDSILAQRGHAKSKRKDLRIVGLALLVSTDFHIPLFSYLYPGNFNDPTVFNQVSQDLVQRYHHLTKNHHGITLVFDGGNPSTENMAVLDHSHFHFITSLTLTHHKDLLQIPLSKFSSFSQPRLQSVTAHRTQKEVWGKMRTVVITRSERLLAGQLAGIQTALHKKRSALWELSSKLRRSQQPQARGKGYTRESLQKRLSDITSGQYVSEILRTEIDSSNGVLKFRFWTDEAAFQRLQRTRLGKRILCTDQSDWTTDQIILASRAQSCIEDAFKQMKNPHWVSFSPGFHWTDQKLRVHSFYCLIALTLSSLLARQSALAGLKLSIPELYKQLSHVTEIIQLYSPKDKAGRPRAQYILSERSAIQEKLCQIFNVYTLAKNNS